MPGVTEVVDARYVWMAEAGRGLCLRADLAFGGAGNQLDRHRAVQPQVMGVPHLAHAADADPAAQDVAVVQVRAGGERVIRSTLAEMSRGAERCS